MKQKDSANKTMTNTTYNITGTSFWDYAFRIWVKSPIFYNFYFVPIISIEGHCDDAAVLRPQSMMPALKIWDYYVGEELSHGPSYDLEMVHLESNQQDEEEDYKPGSAELAEANWRLVVNAAYNSIEHSIPNCFVRMLDQMKLLEAELTFVSKRWIKMWNKIEIPLNSDFESRMALQQRRLRDFISPTMRLSMGGDNGNNQNMMWPVAAAGGAANLYGLRSHNFEPYTATPLTKCDLCLLLIGVRIGCYRCSHCDYCCHETCRERAPRLCDSSGAKAVGCNNNLNVSSPAKTTPEHTLPLINSGGSEVRSDSDSSEVDIPMTYNNGNTNNATMTTTRSSLAGGGLYRHPQYQQQRRENYTFKGYLYKKGALLKAWKLRYYVLDTTLHQVRDQHSDWNFDFNLVN